jgi:hypothetical protein
MDPTKHVLLALTGSAAIFAAAGGRLANLQAKVRGEPPPEATEFEPGTLVGWAVLLAILVFTSDIEPIAPLAVGFAWLIFLSIAMMFGPEAAARILAMMGQQATVPVDPSLQVAPERFGPYPV